MFSLLDKKREHGMRAEAGSSLLISLVMEIWHKVRSLRKGSLTEVRQPIQYIKMLKEPSSDSMHLVGTLFHI